MAGFIEFRREFFKALNKKTVWGKEQVKKLFDDIYVSEIERR